MKMIRLSNLSIVLSLLDMISQVHLASVDHFQSVFVDPVDWEVGANMTIGGLSSELECAALVKDQGFYGSGWALSPDGKTCHAGQTDPQSKGDFKVFVAQEDVKADPPMLVLIGGSLTNWDPPYSNTADVLRAGGTPCTGHGIPALPVAGISGHGAVVAGGNQLYVAGGQDTQKFDTLFLLDLTQAPQDRVWQQKKPMNAPRTRLSMHAFGQKLFVFGADDEAISDEIEEYDISSDTWTTLIDVTLPSTPVYVMTAQVTDSQVWIFLRNDADFKVFDMASKQLDTTPPVTTFPDANSYGSMFFSKDLGRLFFYTECCGARLIYSNDINTPNSAWVTIGSWNQPFGVVTMIPVGNGLVFAVYEDISGNAWERSILHANGTMEGIQQQMSFGKITSRRLTPHSVLVDASVFKEHC